MPVVIVAELLLFLLVVIAMKIQGSALTPKWVARETGAEVERDQELDWATEETRHYLAQHRTLRLIDSALLPVFLSCLGVAIFFTPEASTSVFFRALVYFALFAQSAFVVGNLILSVGKRRHVSQAKREAGIYQSRGEDDW
jgi:hypothetical protein